MTNVLHTIGYEGTDIASFLRTLRAVGVQQLIDIRDVPVSRKPGFSKKALATALDGQGVKYDHLKALGDPKPGREAMRRGDYDAFHAIYTQHLASEAAQEAIEIAVALAKRHVSVLLCFERSPKQCHRTLVAAEMQRFASFRLSDIGVN